MSETGRTRRVPGSPSRSIMHRARHLFHLVTRPLTIGVRAIVIDAEGRLFLVRHSYVAGWHLPGGGVEPGETAEQAITRELSEEANLVIEGRPSLHGVFFNEGASRRDHVLVYAVTSFTSKGPRKPDWEIREAGFFPIDALPPGATRGTLTRISEWRAGTPPSAVW